MHVLTPVLLTNQLHPHQYLLCLLHRGRPGWQVFIRVVENGFCRVTHMHSADYAVARCLSIHLSHAGIESKWLYISSKFFHHLVAPPF